jgi:hypothetical protein
LPVEYNKNNIVREKEQTCTVVEEPEDLEEECRYPFSLMDRVSSITRGAIPGNEGPKKDPNLFKQKKKKKKMRKITYVLNHKKFIHSYTIVFLLSSSKEILIHSNIIE